MGVLWMGMDVSNITKHLQVPQEDSFQNLI